MVSRESFSSNTLDKVAPDSFDGIRERIQEQSLNEVFTFMFKDRSSTGTALHVCCLREDGAEAVEVLLNRRADPASKCNFLNNKKVGTVFPLHLAAATGSVETVRLLLEFRSDVNLMCKLDDKDHYAPLHESAFHCNVENTRYLLSARADVNKLNITGQTALHVAAKSGSAGCARELVRARADVCIIDKDREARTALGYAVGSKYPDDELILLSSKCLSDVKLVASRNPGAAKEMLRNRDVGWKEGFLNPKNGHKPTWSDLVDLITAAPQVAVIVMNLLTEEPQVQHQYKHPLPHVLPRVLRERTLRCEYQPDTEWLFDLEKFKYPSWHDHLAPQHLHRSFSHHVSRQAAQGPSLRPSVGKMLIGMLADLFEYWFLAPSARCCVQLQLLRVPNVVRIEVLMALAASPSLCIFSARASQAIVDHAWAAGVRKQHLCNLCARMLELFVLFTVAVSSFSKDDGYLAQEDVQYLGVRLWRSFLAASAMREVYVMYKHMFCFAFELRDVASYVTDPWNYVHGIAVAFLVFLVLDDGYLVTGGRPEVLAAVSFLRWIEVLYNIRVFAFMNIGYNILPIILSLERIGGILFVALITFFAFFHANLALHADALSIGEHFLGTFRLLLLGSGEFAGCVEHFGGASDYMWGCELGWSQQVLFYLAMMLFFVCILNAFIAAQSHAYNAEIQPARLEKTFYMQRARTCAFYMMMPDWPFEWPKNRVRWAPVVFVVGAGAWIGIAYVDPFKVPVLSAAFLFLAGNISERLLHVLRWKTGRPSIFAALVSGPQRLAERNEEWLGAPNPCSQQPAEVDKFLWWCDWDTEGTSREQIQRPSDVGREARLEASVAGLSEQLAGVAEAVASLERRLATRDSSAPALEKAVTAPAVMETAAAPLALAPAAGKADSTLSRRISTTSDADTAPSVIATPFASPAPTTEASVEGAACFGAGSAIAGAAAAEAREEAMPLMPGTPGTFPDAAATGADTSQACVAAVPLTPGTFPELIM